MYCNLKDKHTLAKHKIRAVSMEGGAQSSFENNKKAALVSLFALGSVLVSYMVYQRVADTESSERRRKHERMVRKARR